jgi:hypothetical protein
MEAAANSFGLDAVGSMSREKEVGMFRPEAVLSGKGGSNHIFGDLYRTSEAALCPGWHVKAMPRCSARRREPAVDQLRRVIFGRMRTIGRPVVGPGS